jgi:hydrogenase-4 component F
MTNLWLPIIIPLVAGIISLFIASDIIKKIILTLTAIIHIILVANLCFFAPETAQTALGPWIGLDSLTRLFLSITSILFFGATVYSLKYLKPDENAEPVPFYKNKGNMFICCLQLFLSAMSLSILSTHFGLQWIGVEATTLASTPIIYYQRNRKSLEAAWKYLIICSVGIALALMGIFFLAMAVPSQIETFTPQGLSQFAGYLKLDWLKIAFIFILVGYGTKLGLAPMHTWLPDAHSEAPSPVSAMLSGALLNCALLAILRVAQVLFQVPDLLPLARELFVLFGLISIVTSGVFILHQSDYKRMLAYSSVEHMGIILFGFGIGKAATAAALLHVICHSLTKSSLFMLAGNILNAYQTKKVAKLHGLLKTMPYTAVLWLAGFLAITGAPPFATFVSEFAILKATIASNSYVQAGIYLFALFLVFIGMLTIFMQMTLGKKPAMPATSSDGTIAKTCLIESESPVLLITPVVFLLLVLVLGCYLPEPLRALINDASAILGGDML